MSYIRNEENYVYSNGTEIINFGLNNEGLIYLIEKHLECPYDEKLKEFIVKELKERFS